MLRRVDDEEDEMDVNDQDVHRLIIVTQVRFDFFASLLRLLLILPLLSALWNLIIFVFSCMWTFCFWKVGWPFILTSFFVQMIKPALSFF